MMTTTIAGNAFRRRSPSAMWRFLDSLPQLVLLLLILGISVLAMPTTATSAEENQRRGKGAVHAAVEPSNFDDSFNILYGSASQIERTVDGRAISLSMTEMTGSGFQSKLPFLFGQLSLKIKLVRGDSSGVVTCFYMHSMTEDHDEFDFEFLGNKSGEPIILQTNIYASGIGGREERIALWFDPAEKFHTYTVLWNHNLVTFYVDSVPIRSLKNSQATRKFFPVNRPMWVFSSIWNGDDWATRGGLDKVNWTNAPFVAHFKDFKLDGCVYNGEGPPPACTSPLYSSTWWSNHNELNSVELRKLQWVRDQYITYDYCADIHRYGASLYDEHPECAFSNRGY